MANEEIKSKLKAFFMSDLGVDGDVLNYDTPLFGEEIGLDSVDSLEIISFVDDNFLIKPFYLSIVWNFYDI